MPIVNIDANGNPLSKTTVDYGQTNNTNNYVDCHVQTTNGYTYELGGRLLKVSSAIADSTNPYDVWSKNYNDYNYYSHEGVIAERHDDINQFKYFTRLGRELLTCNNNGSTYFYPIFDSCKREKVWEAV
jgi:hypothetical protein